MIGDLVGPGLTLLEKAKWFREAGIDTGTVKKMVLIECKKNLALMEPLRLEGPGVSQDAGAIVAVAARIQFDAIEFLLMDNDRAIKAFEELERIPFNLDSVADVETEDEFSESTESSISLGERLQRLYVRMYAVKTLAEISISNEDKEFDGAGRIQFRRRLANLQKVLLDVEKVMSS